MFGPWQSHHYTTILHRPNWKPDLHLHRSCSRQEIYGGAVCGSYGGSRLERVTYDPQWCKILSGEQLSRPDVPPSSIHSRDPSLCYLSGKGRYDGHKQMLRSDTIIHGPQPPPGGSTDLPPTCSWTILFWKLELFFPTFWETWPGLRTVLYVLRENSNLHLWRSIMRLEGRELWCKLILHSGIIILRPGVNSVRIRHSTSLRKYFTIYHAL